MGSKNVGENQTKNPRLVSCFQSRYNVYLGL